MAEKNQEMDQTPANGHSGVDQESLSQAPEAKRKKRIKWAIYIAAFAVFQIIVILVFVMVVMRVRTPKFRVGSLNILSLANNQTSLSFEAPIRIKNMNFGPFKYDAANVTFTSGNVVLDEVAIPKSKVGLMSTKKIDVSISFKGDSLSNQDTSSGVLTLNSKGSLTGKVEVMLIFKKKKTIEMDCVFTIDTRTNAGFAQSECK